MAAGTAIVHLREVRMIIPLGNRVTLESYPDDLRGSSPASPIIAPGMYAETSRYAKVVAISDKARQSLPELDAGDTVICDRYPPSAQAFEFEGRKLVTVNADEIELKVNV